MKFERKVDAFFFLISGIILVLVTEDNQYQWRIQDFPEGGAWTLQGGAWTRQIFPKTAWNRKNLDAQGGGVRPSRPP